MMSRLRGFMVLNKLIRDNYIKINNGLKNKNKKLPNYVPYDVVHIVLGK